MTVQGHFLLDGTSLAYEPATRSPSRSSAPESIQPMAGRCAWLGTCGNCVAEVERDRLRPDLARPMPDRVWRSSAPPKAPARVAPGTAPRGSARRPPPRNGPRGDRGRPRWSGGGRRSGSGRTAGDRPRCRRRRRGGSRVRRHHDRCSPGRRDAPRPGARGGSGHRSRGGPAGMPRQHARRTPDPARRGPAPHRRRVPGHDRFGRGAATARPATRTDGQLVRIKGTDR